MLRLRRGHQVRHDIFPNKFHLQITHLFRDQFEGTMVLKNGRGKVQPKCSSGLENSKRGEDWGLWHYSFALIDAALNRWSALSIVCGGVCLILWLGFSKFKVSNIENNWQVASCRQWFDKNKFIWVIFTLKWMASPKVILLIDRGVWSYSFTKMCVKF